MPYAGRTARALSVVTALGLAATTSAQAHLVEDFGVRRGAPAHISLSTGFNGFVGAGIKKIQVDGVQMDAFCIDPFTMALRSSPGYKFVPLTKAPEAPFTLSASEATEISDLWAMFYNPGMKENKAAGLQLAIWEIVGGDDFSIIGKDYHTEEKVVGYYSTGDRMKTWGGLGAFWGGIWGLLFGAGFFLIPGIGPVLVAGPFLAALLGALESAVLVGGLSAIAAGLVSLGIPKDSARVRSRPTSSS